MKGIILINAYSQMPEPLFCAGRLKEEFEKRGVEIEIRRNDFFAVTAAEQLGCALHGIDFCVYLDKDKYVLQGLEKAGIPLFNSYRAIELCDDKMTTCLALAGQGIKMPLTIPAPLCYDQGMELSEEALDKIEGALGYPLIIKRSYGSRGPGVSLVHSRSELKDQSNALMQVAHLYQQFIASSYGRDVRVIVIGGEVLGAMLRQSETDFRSNVALGGRATEYPLGQEEMQMCKRVAELLELDFCGIDLLFGEDGFYVCEVNSNAFFGGFERATKKNVAGAYAEHILAKLHKSK